jgi:hypothetical protein
MSRSMGVFVATDISLEELVADLADTLGVEFKRISDSVGIRFEAFTPPELLLVYKNDIENSTRIPFEDYRYEIAIWAEGFADHKERDRVLLLLARARMETLEKQGKYRLMLVDDLQRKLDEFVPDSVK